MDFSIPADYLNEIQNKLDIGLIISYKRIFYKNINENEDDVKFLLNKHLQGKTVFFRELVVLDNIYHAVISDIREYIESDFIAKINENDEDFSKSFEKRRNSWRVERSRWKNNKTVRKNSRKILEYIKESCTSEEWAMKYNCHTLEEYFFLMEDKVKKWAKENEYFYSFPYFEYLSEKQKKRGILYDIEKNIVELINKDRLLDYYISKPEYLSDTPIYTQKKEQIKMIDDNGILKAETQTGEDSKLTYFTIPKEKISVPENADYSDCLELMKTLDAVDNELTDWIMTKIIESGANLYTFAKATFTLSELSTKVLGWHGSSGIENVRKRLLNLVRPISFSNGKNEIAVTLFDSCFITEDDTGKQIATLTPGTTFKEAYIKNQLIYIARKKYERLKYPLSKHLCYNLQRDRVGLASFNQPLTKEYNLIYFDRIVQFGTNDKKYKFEHIQKSLDEFVQMKFLVKKYEITKRGFLVTFHPFTEAEWKDLKNVRKQKIIDMDMKEIKDKN